MVDIQNSKCLTIFYSGYNTQYRTRNPYVYRSNIKWGEHQGVSVPLEATNSEFVHAYNIYVIFVKKKSFIYSFHSKP